MIKIHTIGGNTYGYKGSYQEIQRAIKDVSCRYLYGLNRKNCRVIIPLAALDSIEEVEMSYWGKNMTTYLHMKSGDVYEVDYLSIQPFLQQDQVDFASYIFNNGRRGLFEANVLVNNETYGHITFYAQDVESIEQVTIDD